MRKVGEVNIFISALEQARVLILDKIIYSSGSHKHNLLTLSTLSDL